MKKTVLFTLTLLGLIFYSYSQQERDHFNWSSYERSLILQKIKIEQKKQSK